MKIRRRDVVIIDHPFSDASGSKVRPALVVQSDSRNAIMTETILAMISKNVRHVVTDPTQVLVDIGTTDDKAAGLNLTSVVKCGKLFTVHENLIRKKIGVMSAALMRQVDDCLKKAMELP